jgi:hypothetical protein
VATLIPLPGRVIAVTGSISFQAHRDRIVGFESIYAAVKAVKRWSSPIQIMGASNMDELAGA